MAAVCNFACGLLGGVLLNFLIWSASLNMGVMMVLFTLSGFIVVLKAIRHKKANHSLDFKRVIGFCIFNQEKLQNSQQAL